MWAKLTSLVQQLLQQTVLEDEEALGASLTMAGALADTASTVLQANRPDSSADADTASVHPAVNSNQSILSAQNSNGSGSSKAAGACESAASTAVLLLEFAVELLDNAKQRAAAMGPQQQQQQQSQDPSGGTSPLTQQVADIQQQVGFTATAVENHHVHLALPLNTGAQKRLATCVGVCPKHSTLTRCGLHITASMGLCMLSQ
jgi:hypothetical protein